MLRTKRSESIEEHQDDTDSNSDNKSSSSTDEKKGKIESESTPRKEKRRIHWKPTAKVILIPKREEYINAGLGSTLWWEGRDYISFKHSTADELSRCMKSLQIGGREAMTVLYQSGCPKFQSTVFENLVIAIPQSDAKESSCTPRDKRGEFKRDTAHTGAEKFYSIVSLACLISAIDCRTDNCDVKYMNMNIRCSTSLLFEQILSMETIEPSPALSRNNADSAKASMTSSNNQDLTYLWDDVSRTMCENAIRYRGISPQSSKLATATAAATAADAKKSKNNPIFSSCASTDLPTLPSTWEEAIYGEEWTDKSFVITEDKPPYKIVYCNKSWESLTGYTANDFVGKNFRILHGPLTQHSKYKRIGQQLQLMREEREAEKKKSSWLTNPPPPKYLKASIINYTKKGNAFNMILLMCFIEKHEADRSTDLSFILATNCLCRA